MSERRRRSRSPRAVELVSSTDDATDSTAWSTDDITQLLNDLNHYNNIIQTSDLRGGPLQTLDEATGLLANFVACMRSQQPCILALAPRTARSSRAGGSRPVITRPQLSPGAIRSATPAQQYCGHV